MVEIGPNLKEALTVCAVVLAFIVLFWSLSR
jgi:hypothetical protein